MTVCQSANVPIGVVDTSSVWSYSWSPGTGLSDPMVPNPVCSVNVTTQYVVTISHKYASCAVKRDTVVVTVEEPVTVPVLNDYEACEGDTIVLHTTVIPNTVYHWSGSPGILNPDSIYSLYVVEGIDTVILEVTDTTLHSSCKTGRDTMVIFIRSGCEWVETRD